MTANVAKPNAATVLVARGSDGNLYEVSCDTSGNLQISATVQTGDVEIGAVELKDAATDSRATISNGAVLVRPDGNYKTVAASQTDAVCGATGAAGDFLSHILIVPASTSPGAVSVKDGSGSAITVFAGGTNSVLSLTPFAVPLQWLSAAGAWKITTGASVSVVAAGKFT